MTLVIDRAALGRRTSIAAGGLGEVYRVDGFQLRPDPTPLAYKEFTSEHVVQARAARAAVDLWEGLSPSDRTVLDRLSTWPRALVHDGTGQECGLLMPLLAPEFLIERTDSHTGSLKSKACELQWLVASAAQRDVNGISLPPLEVVDRLVLLAQLVYVVAWLHKHGWVYGDLSLKNVAFAPAHLTVN